KRMGVRCGDRGAARQARSVAQTYGALLRGVSDHPQRPAGCDHAAAEVMPPSCPRLSRASTSCLMSKSKTWIAGTSPAVTIGDFDMPPDLSFWLELVFKMAMTATVVVVISLVVERSGPFIGAMIAALPTAAGAAYVILAIEHPSNFIAASAVGSMAIGAAVSVFAAVYALLAQRHGLVI